MEGREGHVRGHVEGGSVARVAPPAAGRIRRSARGGARVEVSAGRRPLARVHGEDDSRTQEDRENGEHCFVASLICIFIPAIIHH